MSKTTGEEKTTAAKDEGARAFGVLLMHLDEGCVHAELSEEVQRITKLLSDAAENMNKSQKGKLTLTLNFIARANGTVDVHADVAAKTPKPPRAGSTFWATKAGNLSPENPRQARLPIREAPTPEAKPRDLPAEAKPVRTV